MKPPVERVKVSKRGKDILIKVKRNTGLQHWNEICRIALFRSLADGKKISKRSREKDSNIEMDWKTFAGCYEEEIRVLLMARAHSDDVFFCDDGLAEYFRDHLERGINSMRIINNFKDLL
jgi:DNA sulfur modification protein DndE